MAAAGDGRRAFGRLSGCRRSPAGYRPNPATTCATSRRVGVAIRRTRSSGLSGTNLAPAGTANNWRVVTDQYGPPGVATRLTTRPSTDQA